MAESDPAPGNVRVSGCTCVAADETHEDTIENADEQQIQQSSLPSDPVRLPLTRQKRILMHNQMVGHKAETQQALLTLKGHKSKVGILACPVLWKEKEGVRQVNHAAGRSLGMSSQHALRRMVDKLRPKEVHLVLLLE